MTHRRQFTLTEQELQAAYLTPYDLGPGYPQLEVPTYVHDLYLDNTADDISLRFPPVWTPDKQAHVDKSLEFAVKQFLGISDDPQITVRHTFTGSIALDRALSATQLLARKGRVKELVVITTSPSIDIMRQFLEERAEVRPHFVENRTGNQIGEPDLIGLLEAIGLFRNRKSNVHVAVLLSSPENPTGAIWSAQALRQIARECDASDSTLIIDHCFAVAGIHSPSDVARVWDLPADSCRWLAIWDTGKTFGLNEDKLGFIICGNSEIGAAVETSVAVLQFGVARRAKIFFSELLRKAILYDHVGQLRDLCRENLATLEAYSTATSAISLVETHAGSLAMLDIKALGRTDEEVRRKLLADGIGVISGNVFFHTKWKPKRYIRLALARRPDYFREAVDRLWKSLTVV